MRRRSVQEAILAVACLAVGACATADTPRQALAHERWAACAVPYVQLERIDLDGRITFQFSDSATRQRVLQCLSNAGRTGASLPEPRAVRPAGGP
jgi:hypothetical protein